MSSKLRIIPLGGLGEIGKNMTVFEYEDEIIIVDAGVMFPENDMLGIDLIIPDYKYLLDKKDKILAVLITHGHEDHVGALSHLMADINVPVYGTPLTVGLIEAKLREAVKTGLPKPILTKDLIAAAKEVRPTTREWFSTARNHALYANEGGLYDEVLDYLKIKR